MLKFLRKCLIFGIMLVGLESQIADSYPGKCFKPYICDKEVTFKQDPLDCIDKCYDITPMEMVQNKQPHRECRKKLFNSEKFTDKVRKSVCYEKKGEYRKCLRKKARMLALKLKSEYNDNKKLKQYPHDRQDCLYECIKKQFGDLKCDHPRFPSSGGGDPPPGCKKLNPQGKCPPGQQT